MLTSSSRKPSVRSLWVNMWPSGSPWQRWYLWNRKKTCQTGSLLENTARDPFNQNSNRSDREKWSTSKGGPVFRNFSGWTEPIHWVLDRNFRKFWLNGSRPRSRRRTRVSLLIMETERDKNNRILPPASLRSQKLKKLVCYTESKNEGQVNEKRGRCLKLQQPNDGFYETIKRHWTKHLSHVFT